MLAPLAEAHAQAYTNPFIWQMCKPDPLAKLIRPDTGAQSSNPAINFTADTAQSSPSEASLSGQVIVDQGDRRLEASKVTLDRLTNRVRASKEVSYGDPRLAVRSNEAELDLNQDTGEFLGAQYFIPYRNAQGDAGRVTVDRNARTSTLEEVTYSTCERGNELWELRTDQLNLDQKTGRGSARDITLAVKDIPVFYFPYLSFPINDERQSGFLTPSFGLDEDSGLDVRVPYYWNIAPNMDATIAPRVLTNRGVMLGAEYRFLYPEHRGQVSFEVLPNDQEFGKTREAFYIDHQANPSPGLFTDLLYQYVSDDEYLDDLDNNLDLLNPTYLERHFDTVYFGGAWTARSRLQSFQTIDNDIFVDVDEPYDRLPQLLFDGTWPDRGYGLSYDIHSEFVYFDRNEGVTGARLDFQPGISLPLERPEAYITPRLSYRYTAYELNDADPGFAESPTRSAPIFSIDSGLFLERPIQWEWLGGDGLQTLEPRLFYLYVPERNQDNIPLFDSTEVDRSYAWLFLENRFTGADRLGDANQLTTAVTTRLINVNTGREQLRASVGQIHYFRDREVTLDNTDPEQDSTSDLIAETLFSVTPELSLRGTLQYDPDREITRRSALDLRYLRSDGKLLNMSHRFSRDDDLEQVDVAFVWPVNNQWRTVGRWNYSLESDRNLDLFAGFEYGECCWALRMLARQHRDSPDDNDAKNSVYLEVELKGLAGIGSSINNIVEDAILGYKPIRYR